MERLASLDLDRTSIRELPASIERLQGLVSLNLKNCKSLFYLPDSICNLLSLEWLTLRGCSKLSKLPEDLWYLKRLDIVETSIRGCRPKQQFITLRDLAPWKPVDVINAMVPNNEQNEAVANVESRLPWRGDSKILTDPEDVESLHRWWCERVWTDIEESSYLEEMRRRHLEEEEMRRQRRRLKEEEMQRRHYLEVEEMRRRHLEEEEMRRQHLEEPEMPLSFLEKMRRRRWRHLEERWRRQRHLEEEEMPLPLEEMPLPPFEEMRQ
ncbi:hypothetical protein ACFX16_028420 [Malus domestica]